MTEACGETARLLDRLSRRGELTIQAKDGALDVRLVIPGPYVRGSCSTDKADLFEHCHLGAKDWHGEGDDLAALLAACEDESRPRAREVDDLVWEIEWRRDSRTHGPPLPTYQRWRGWTPGHDRWLRTSSHAFEYLGGFERDLRAEQDFEDERAADRARRALPQVPRRMATSGRTARDGERL